MTASRAAIAVFAALVASTVGAFFVAQELKTGPSLVQQLRVYPVVSPNGDGRKDGARISFLIREDDDLRIEVVDEDGDLVKEIYDRHLDAYTGVQVRWNGRDERGRVVPDGRYRYRMTFRRQGRSFAVPRSFRVDTAPPRPRIVGIGPTRDTRPRPELLPRADGRPATVTFLAPGGQRRVLLFKTGPGRPRLVHEAPLADGVDRWTWNGRVRGRRASAGTYLVVGEARDLAGNIGTSVPLNRLGLPATTYGSGLPGRGGITVRYLAVQPPIEPTRAAERGEFFVDARRARYRWSLRRVGSPEVRKRGSGSRPRLAIAAPRGEGGVFLLEVRTRRHAVRVPWVVRPRSPLLGTARAPRGALVILPMTTWQGRNPVDDDGDGLPDVLDRGLPVRLHRVMIGDGGGLPVGFATGEAPLLAHLDRTGRRYDVTTDTALAAGVGPQFADGYRGVVLPGDARWLDARVARRLRAFVRRGGTVASFGTRSLLREVRQTPRARLVQPTAQAPADLFGARLGERIPDAGALTDVEDEIALFEGTDGRFDAVGPGEPTLAVGDQAQRVAAAATAAGQPIVVAARFGRGLVIRTGLPGLPSRVNADPDLAQLVRNAWTRLR